MASVRPRVLTVSREAPDPAALREAADVLQAGGLVAFPTETVYGLGARALDPRCLRRIFEAKGRPSSRPLIAHVHEREAARALTSRWPEAAERLAQAFWPGPLTLVVDRAPHVPSEVAGGGPSIAVRVPAHPVARALLLAVREPLAAPSANRYQSLSPTTAAHVVKSLGDRVDLVLDGGSTDAGIESTVVDVRGDVPRILRPGALDAATLRAVLPAIVSLADAGPLVTEGGTAEIASPGLDLRHYAPAARLELVPDRRTASERQAALVGQRVAIVAWGAWPDAPERVHLLPADPAGYATRLFATLHAMDDAGHDVVIVVSPPAAEAWAAVHDRLGRMCA